jgi:hypothetical protein
MLQNRASRTGTNAGTNGPGGVARARAGRACFEAARRPGPPPPVGREAPPSLVTASLIQGEWGARGKLTVGGGRVESCLGRLQTVADTRNVVGSSRRGADTARFCACSHDGAWLSFSLKSGVIDAQASRAGIEAVRLPIERGSVGAPGGVGRAATQKRSVVYSLWITS